MRKILMVALCLVILPALAAAKCTQEGGGGNAPKQPNPPAVQPPAATGKAPKPDPHAGDPQPSGAKNRVITFTFRIGTKDQLPGEYYISTTGSGVNPVTVGPEPIADTHVVTATVIFDANAPDDLRVNATLKLRQTGPASFCSINAGRYGQFGPRFAGEFGDKEVTCSITIRRPEK